MTDDYEAPEFDESNAGMMKHCAGNAVWWLDHALTEIFQGEFCDAKRSHLRFVEGLCSAELYRSYSEDPPRQDYLEELPL